MQPCLLAVPLLNNNASIAAHFLPQSNVCCVAVYSSVRTGQRRILRLWDQIQTSLGRRRRNQVTLKMRDTIYIEPWRSNAFQVIKDLIVDRSALDRIIQAGGYTSILPAMPLRQTPFSYLSRPQIWRWMQQPALDVAFV